MKTTFLTSFNYSLKRWSIKTNINKKEINLRQKFQNKSSTTYATNMSGKLPSRGQMYKILNIIFSFLLQNFIWIKFKTVNLNSKKNVLLHCLGLTAFNFSSLKIQWCANKTLHYLPVLIHCFDFHNYLVSILNKWLYSYSCSISKSIQLTFTLWTKSILLHSLMPNFYLLRSC